MPPAPLLWLVVFFNVFLLIFVLVRWCPDVASMSRVLLFTVIWAANLPSFGAQTLPFGMLVASTLAPWGTIE